MSEGLSEIFSESVSTSTAEPIKPPVSTTKISRRPGPPSAAQIAASRSNGKKGTGPRDTTSTKFNAIKHGLLAIGITELDDADGYRDKLRELQHELLPVGLVEEFLVNSIALEMVRLERARRLEAEFITEVLYRRRNLMNAGYRTPLPSNHILNCGAPMQKSKPIAGYARMWQRELFSCKHGKRAVVRELEILSVSRNEEVSQATKGDDSVTWIGRVK